MNLNQWFEKGISIEEYQRSLEKHKEGFHQIYDQFHIPEKDQAFIQQLKQKNWRIIVLAEPWCGHCMLNIPVLQRLAESANLPVKILPRDQHLELMDQYLTNGKRVIPIFVFINEHGEEVAKWGPVASKTKEFVEQHKKDLPPKNAEDYDEKFQSLIQLTSKTFIEDETFRNASYEEIKQTLQQAM